MPCEAYFVGNDGKGTTAVLQLPRGWPQSQFVKNFPSWYPDRIGEGGRYLGPASKSELQWTADEKPPTIASVSFPSRVIVSFTYGETDRVIAWDQGGGTFCPMLIMSGDEQVAGISAADTLTWQGRTLINQRVYSDGMGALQDSYFFGEVQGALKHLVVDDAPVKAYMKDHNLDWSTHGGGFCRHSLEYESLTTGQNRLRVTYKLIDDRIVADVMTVLPYVEKSDCDQYYNEGRSYAKGQR